MNRPSIAERLLKKGKIAKIELFNNHYLHTKTLPTTNSFTKLSKLIKESWANEQRLVIYYEDGHTETVVYFKDYIRLKPTRHI